jgi:hypothetical protein
MTVLLMALKEIQQQARAPRRPDNVKGRFDRGEEEDHLLKESLRITSSLISKTILRINWCPTK